MTGELNRSNKQNKNLEHLKYESLAPKIEPPHIFFKSVLLQEVDSAVCCCGGRSPTEWNNSISLKLQIPGEIIPVFGTVAVYKEKM